MTKGKYNKQHLISFGVCLVAATLLWYLNALNKEYQTEISYPVRYLDLPKDKMLVGELPRQMTLEFRAHGFVLLRHKISANSLPIVINVNTDILGERDILKRSILTNQLRYKIQSQFTGMQLLDIKPDTLHFEFSRYLSKMVPVIPQVNYTLKRQFILKEEIAVNPPETVVTGPAELIDTITAVYTRPIQLRELAKDVDRKVALSRTKGVETDISEATVSIRLEKHTGVKLSVPVVVRNLPDQYKIRLFPPHIEVSFDVGLSRYDAMRDTSFIFSVDYSQIGQQSASLPVKLEKQPPFIRHLTYTPERVEYLLEEK